MKEKEKEKGKEKEKEKEKEKKLKAKEKEKEKETWFDPFQSPPVQELQTLIDTSWFSPTNLLS